MDSLVGINGRLLQCMTSSHHMILVCLVAYLIRYCSAACYYDTMKTRPKTCITSPINAALNRKIEASNTCGNPSEGFCYIGPQRQCEICNSNHPNQSHPADLMVDQFSLTEVTWWQSMTWWTSNQLGLSKMFGPLQVVITLDIKKKYLISGGIYITFKTERPKQMIVERSSNYGQTWNVYQYYAKNCRSAYNLQPDPFVNPFDPFKPICSELYSGEFPRSGGVVHFDPRTRYKPMNYYNDNVDKYLEATNIRLKLEYPGTDGREYINEESTLNQYFYAISDFRVDARCDCNGHAEYCDSIDGIEQCDCEHYTEGIDCSSCEPLYRNRKWMAGNATNANPCQKCECYDHAISCTYNDFLKQGICDSCQHNTRGIKCGQCAERFYRNLSLPLNNPEVCTPCNCYEPGIQDDGKCMQSASNTQQLGQCNCKPGIYGRRCDQCIPGKWGYVTPPVGTCFDCACNMYGTLNNNQICDQYIGQCKCKDSIEGRTCDVCKEGFYKFPTVMNQPCQPCPCNKGGALPSCNKVTGLCSCKVGVTGPTCDRPKAGFFFPNFTYVSSEPEFANANGTFTPYFLIRNYARYFTGLGFARIDAGQFITFKFTVPTTARYFTLGRYSLYQIDFYSSMLPQGREKIDWAGSTDKRLYFKGIDNANNWKFDLKIEDMTKRLLSAYTFSINDLELGNDRTLRADNSIELEKDTTYQFSLEYQSQSLFAGSPWPLLLDSVIFMLDYNFTPYYSSLSSDVIKSEVQACFADSQALATSYNLPSYCGAHIFTVDLQLFGQALACSCFQPGSFQWNSCAEFGGQCQCKQGYGSRRCDQCIPGYYGNPTSGCIPCGCSQVGSLSSVCHQETGQCTCKGNAHGLKCDECLIGFFHLSASNPRGCQECFGYGHLISCKAAIGFTRSYVAMNFIGTNDYRGWKLRSPFGFDQTNLILDTSVGMDYTDETNMHYYFDAPQEFLGDQLYSFGQTLKVQLKLFTLIEKLASTEWHVRLQGNGKTALFKFMEPLSQSRRVYSIVLHQEYMINISKLSEFQFKAMLGQLTALHIGVVYFEAPVTVTLQNVELSTARYQPTITYDVSRMLNYIEHATCVTGYVGLSCETCAPGYTRLIPNGGPLINCIPCACNNRSKKCDPQTGVCSNCRPGTMGSYCEKCMENVLEPSCDQCKPGFWGLYTQTNGCKPCNCYLPGTHNGDTVSCDSSSGQCVCNKTINVGGRQCNVCKENSFNISLGDALRCQECPVCYGLIEHSVLQVRQDMFHVEINVQQVATTVNSLSITPFFQAITYMEATLMNITERANQGKMTSSGLDFLWQTLDDQINIFLKTLQESTMIKVTNLLTIANAIFITHNTTLFQHAGIHKFLINSYNLVNNTVRARMQQQVIALNQLTNLANEMQRYVTMSTTNANTILTKKYDLKQKITLSLNAAVQAVESATQTRALAFNLTGGLAPIRERGLQVNTYAQTCVASIDVWLNNATRALSYAQTVLSSIALQIPDHGQKISNLKALTKSLKNKFNNFGTKLFNLQSDINAVAMEITKLKTSLHRTQISSAERRSSLLYTNLIILRNKTNQAIASGVKVQSEATTMLNTVQNFMDVATNAQNAANGALAKVDLVKKSVEMALTTAESIRRQIQAPKTAGERALRLMQEAHTIVMNENEFIAKMAEEASKLQNQIQSATTLIQGQQINNYIAINVTPLLLQCKSYETRTKEALNQAYSAYLKAFQAHTSSVTTAQKISLLSTNINQIQILNTGQLDNLLASINRIKNNYASLQIASSLDTLRKAKSAESTKISYYRTTNSNLKTKLTVYRLLYNSLASLSC